MSKQNSDKSLLDQGQALYAYLDELLQEVDEQSPPLRVIDAPAPVVETDLPPVAPAQQVVTEPEDEAFVSPEVHDDEQQQAFRIPKHAPAWAHTEFQCLLFTVAGLQLAVPLQLLNGVIPWKENVTPMPNHSEHFLGLLNHLEQNVKVVDTARVILPQRSQATDLPPHTERVNHILLVDEGRWGLACDAIGEVITLAPDAVRWRTPEGKRPWLAGTVLSYLCALLDVPAFTTLLVTGKE